MPFQSISSVRMFLIKNQIIKKFPHDLQIVCICAYGSMTMNSTLHVMAVYWQASGVLFVPYSDWAEQDDNLTAQPTINNKHLLFYYDYVFLVF